MGHNACHLERCLKVAADTDTIRMNGKVDQIIGLVVESIGPPVSVGEMCHIENPSNGTRSLAEVAGFRSNKVLLIPLQDTQGIGPGNEVVTTRTPLFVGVGAALLGRVIDGLGRPIDGLGPIHTKDRRPIYRVPPSPLKRQRISEPIPTGIKAIDAFLTCGKGQRMGIVSGSGVGKSILLGMIARNTAADVNVIALVGERGREVREFIERDLGADGLERSVVVVATSDQAAPMRLKGALVATTIAEYFRDQGKNVMLMMDSITRLAFAQREIGLAVGEPPTTKGYPPSVFALLPKLLERTGAAEVGSITGLYAVLAENDDLNEPIADAARSILDGHIVLSRKLSVVNHYPAIDVLESVSRVMNDITSERHQRAVQQLSELIAIYREAEDLIRIGAYVAGSDPQIDRAISMMDRINTYLRQGMYDRVDFEDTINSLIQLASSSDGDASVSE